LFSSSSVINGTKESVAVAAPADFGSVSIIVFASLIPKSGSASSRNDPVDMKEVARFAKRRNDKKRNHGTY